MLGRDIRLFLAVGMMFAGLGVGAFGQTTTVNGEPAPSSLPVLEAPPAAAPSVRTNRSGFRPEVRTDYGYEQLPVRRAYLTNSLCQIGFQLPDGYQLYPSDLDKVTFLSPDGIRGVSIRLVSSIGAGASELDADSCRSQALSCFAGSQIIAENPFVADGRHGAGFDLIWSGPTRLPMAARVVYVPSPAGVVEFRAVSPEGNFTEVQSELNLVLVTLRASDASKPLRMPVISDKL